MATVQQQPTVVIAERWQAFFTLSFSHVTFLVGPDLPVNVFPRPPL